MSETARLDRLPNEILSMICDSLADEDILAFHFSCEQIYGITAARYVKDSIHTPPLMMTE